MPEIRDLLRDAAPDARPYDEDAVRGRVGARRRRRRAATGLLAVLALVAGVGGAMALDGGDDGEPVVADQPVTPAKVAGVTAVAFVHDDVWTGDETGRVGPEGADGFTTTGPVRLIEVGDEVWVAGDDWVTAIDPMTMKDVGTWETGGGSVADIQPLEGQHVAISLPDSDEIAVVRVAAEGLEEIERIPVGGGPTNLVLTVGNALWVNDGDVICLIDWGAGGSVEEQSWSGALLAPSASGGIWAVDGDRVVDLAPHLLGEGQSVALGARIEFAGATMASGTLSALYLGGADGIAAIGPNDQVPTPLTADVPTSMAANASSVVYVANGSLQRVGVPSNPAMLDATAEDTVRVFLAEVLHWPDREIDDVRTPQRSDGPAEDVRLIDASSSTLDRDARVTVERVGSSWEVTGLTTFGGEDLPGEISLGSGHDRVAFGHREDGLTPELTVRYGESEKVLPGEPGGAAEWEGDFGFVADTEGFLLVVWRDADGVAEEAWAMKLLGDPVEAPPAG